MSIAQKHVVITRAITQAEPFAQALRQHQAIPVLFPCLDIAPIITVAQLQSLAFQLHIGRYDWIFVTSANAVHMLQQQCLTHQIDWVVPAHVQIAAIGQHTAHAITAAWQCSVDVIADVPSAHMLVQAMTAHRPRHVCWLTTPHADNHFVDVRYAVDRIDIYTSVVSQGGADFRQFLATRQVDIITWHSGTAVHAFIDRMIHAHITRSDLHHVIYAAFGQSSLKACQQLGITPHIFTADMHVSAWIDALRKHCTTTGDSYGLLG